MRIAKYDLHYPVVALLKHLGVTKQKKIDGMIKSAYEYLGEDIFIKAFDARTTKSSTQSYIIDNVHTKREYEYLVNNGYLFISVHMDDYLEKVDAVEYMKPFFSLYNFGAREDFMNDLEILIHRILIHYGS